MSITFNPAVTSTAAGSFSVSSWGYIQGFALDDPAFRNTLAGGLLATSESLPMWGGVGITETLTPTGASGSSPDAALGGSISRATTIGGPGTAGTLTGFSVFNQNQAAINTPQSPVPLVGNGGLVNFHRLGSKVRIPVACDAAILSYGSLINAQFSWDFVGQQLVPYVAAYNAATPTGYAYNSATGVLALTFASAPSQAAGIDVAFAGCNVAALNGTWKIASIAGNVMNLTTVPNLSGAPTAGAIVAGGGTLPVSVLDIAASNCLTVTYSPVTGFATWNQAGATALILI